jgi:DNA-binding CsgD family transcriptional regulator
MSNTTVSEMEQEVLRLAAAGLTSKNIAQHLLISRHTVEEYWKRVRKKLNARNKVHAVAIALQVGLIR